ncbi:hypothetical protein P4H39_06460 [Paenibacillus lautus]|uniref:hypothetical protein n=1 Tax=Paenibacillus lautus TaxID=1401 RepID=UPI002DB7CC93|nr:hypothetical protein [Paenibacillus lautus]MEC0202271.1 hypothetical protein [Paenibacillus lautus]
MKHKLFGKLALSAALLGTAAVPVHASGADTSDVPNQPGKSAPIQAATTISILPNPLELAEKYAPETVQDWKETLEKYGKLAGDEGKGVFYFSEAKSLSPTEGEREPGPTEGGIKVSIAVAATPAVNAKDMKDIKEIKDTKEFQEIKIKGALTPIEGGVIEVAELVKSDSGEIQHDVVQDEVASVQAVKLSDEDLAFIHARIDLFKAVDSKDSDAIKDALAKLLDQYKEQITTLEAAAK